MILTAEKRRYIIFEHYYRGRHFNEIAAELDIAPSTISNDKNRKEDIWDFEKKWLEFVLKSRFNNFFDKSINELRTNVIEILCHTTELHEIKREVNVAAENNTITPEHFANFLKYLADMENALAEVEKQQYISLTQLLEERYEIRRSPKVLLKDIAEIERDPPDPP